MKDSIKSSPIVTRFAPSPTGTLHIGGFRTALFNYLYSKHNNGKVILRIEDTDRDRSQKEYEKNILEGLEWLGLSFDEIYRQSDRSKIYSSYLKRLVETGKAYISKEDVDVITVGKRSEVIRFRNPKTSITFLDIIRGETTFDTTELGDFVIAKSLDEPLYHLAVVVDDHEMGVTHVIRGEDHISNTPRQILIGEAIGATRPIYAHLPLILAPDRSKLSKRKGARALTEYRDQGYLPEALVNYMALLGWNPGTNQELFSINELIQTFDISKVQKGGAVYNEEKLRWINKEYLKRKAFSELISDVEDRIRSSQEFTRRGWKLPKGLVSKIVGVVVDRISAFGDIDAMIEAGELDYFFDEPQYEKGDLVWRDDGTADETIAHLEEALRLIESAGEKTLSDPRSVKDLLWNYASDSGRGAVLWPIRFALSGKVKSPDPFTLVSILGKDIVLKRLKKAVSKLGR